MWSWTAAIHSVVVIGMPGGARPLSRASTATLLLALAAFAALLAVCGGAAARATDAGIDRALNVTDTAHLRFIEESGSKLVEEGTATGALPGTVKVRFNVGATVAASFTIYARGGSISGTGSGSLHSSGLYASFGGSMTVTHGTGRYAHAHGHGGFFGTINRHSYAVVVQTTGSLSY